MFEFLLLMLLVKYRHELVDLVRPSFDVQASIEPFGGIVMKAPTKLRVVK